MRLRTKINPEKYQKVQNLDLKTGLGEKKKEKGHWTIAVPITNL